LSVQGDRAAVSVPGGKVMGVVAVDWGVDQMKGTRGYAVGGSEWTAAVAMGNVVLWVS
jgi:hypothetical protein